MGAGRGGAKSRRSSHYFPEKNTCGGILFFHVGSHFFYEGVLGGLSQNMSQKAKKPRPPPPHGEKIAKRPPQGEKLGKLMAPTWRKSNKMSSHILGNFFFIFRGGVRLLLHPLSLAGVYAPVPF